MEAEKTNEGGNATVTFWLTELGLSEKYFKPWVDSSRQLIRRYRDERQDLTRGPRKAKRLHILWSNVETLKPAIYARTPKTQVERRFKDKDKLAMYAGLILERATQFQIDDGPFDRNAKEARDDYLLPGRGQMWVRYVPEFGEEKTPADGGDPYAPVVAESVKVEYVPWEDFTHQRARRWDEVSWVARKVYLTRAELRKQFPDCADHVTLDYSPKDVADDDKITKDQQEAFKKAMVWEIWDRASGKVLHICAGYKAKPLREEPAPLKLKRFFPCPRPMYATLTTDSSIPIPDFHFYKDQADQLDDLQARESLLVKALRVRGVYDASFTELQRLASEGEENDLIPVENYISRMNLGGLKSAVDYMPLRDIAEVLIRIYENQEKKKAEIYEITGIADIVRGVSAPSETAAAQQIKGQFATLRISDRQSAFQEFLCEVIQIVSEIIAEQFAPQTLMAITGLDVTEGDEQAYIQACDLLRNDALRSYRVSIETDSTVAIDEAADKAARSEFLNSVGAFMQKAMPLIQTFPTFGAVMGEMLMYGTRGYKAGRQLEGALQTAIDTMVQQIEQAAAQPPEQQQDPAMMELQAKAQFQQAQLQQDGQLKQAQFQQQAQLEGARLQLDSKKLEMEWAKEQQRAQLEVQKTQATLALEAEKARADLALKAEGMRQKNTLDTARQTTAATQKGVKPNGKPLKPPIVRKVGKVYRDAEGNKTVEMIEIPIEQEDEAAEGEDKAA